MPAISRYRKAALIAVLMGLSGSALAATPAFEITPFATYGGGGSFVEEATQTKTALDAATGAALALNWRATDTSEYELLYARAASQTDSTTPLDMKVEYLHIGGLTDLGDPERRVMPYAVAGLGATRFSPDGFDKKTRWSVNLGGGMRVNLAKHVRLRFEARGFVTITSNESCLFESNGTCTLKPSGSDVFVQYQGLGGVSVAF